VSIIKVIFRHFLVHGNIFPSLLLIFSLIVPSYAHAVLMSCKNLDTDDFYTSIDLTVNADNSASYVSFYGKSFIAEDVPKCKNTPECEHVIRVRRMRLTKEENNSMYFEKTWDEGYNKEPDTETDLISINRKTGLLFLSQWNLEVVETKSNDKFEFVKEAAKKAWKKRWTRKFKCQ
jgi:hypothetical protein